MNAVKVFSRGRRETRYRRDAREDACDKLEYGSTISEAVADVAGDINSIPVIGKLCGIITGGVAAVAHVTKAGMAIASIALKCDDIPFDEIKEIMDKRFNELERKLDENAEAMKKVTEMVSKTLDEVEKVRTDMNKGFNKILEEVQFLSTKESITQIHNVVEYFNSEKGRMGYLPKDEYITKLEEENGILDELKNSRTTKKDTLNTAMHEIIFNGAAIPKNADDENAFKALYALYYAAQSYVAIFGFLLESHSYLANYFYQTGYYRGFNEQVDRIKTTFSDFKFSLTKPNYGHLVKIKDIIETVKRQPFFSNVKNDMFQELSDRVIQLNKLITRIDKMNLPVIKDTPPKAILQFKKPVFNTPVGDWKDGINVRYAVQFEKDGIYSKLSGWSEKLPITNKACPFVKVPVDTEGRNRLVFRQIDDNIPQLVGILVNPDVEFRDINRDLYNAAGAVDKESATENVRKLIEHGADVNAVFELGRTALHRAAIAGNKDVMNLLLDKGFKNINIEDDRGYTPLHLAAEFGTVGFISEIISKGANPDAITNENFFTPLHLAAKSGFNSAVANLVTRTHKINAIDKNGFTPLHYAVSSGYRLVDKFNQYYQDINVAVNATSDTGLTALHLAAMKGIIPAINALEESNILDANVGDDKGMTPLHYAAMLGKEDVIKRLLKLEHVDINAVANENRWTPLHYAIYFKKPEAAKLLMKSKNININLKANGGCTPLHFAAMTDQFGVVIEVMAQLIAQEGSIEDVTDEGYTALHLAAMLEKPQIAAILIQEGANIDALTEKEQTPLQIAVNYGNAEVEAFIKSRPRFRRGVNQGNPRFFKSKPENSLQFELGYKQEPFVLNNQAVPLHSLKLIDSKNSFKRSIPTPIPSSMQNIDPISTLLLLDLILRKITKESYVPFSNGFLSNYEANARALDITEKFEELLNGLNDLLPVEQIDLSDVYRKVKRALLSGNESKIENILCSFAEKVFSADSKYFDKLKVAFQESKTTNFQAEVAVEIKEMLENTCGK